MRPDTRRPNVFAGPHVDRLKLANADAEFVARAIASLGSFSGGCRSRIRFVQEHVGRCPSGPDHLIAAEYSLQG